jgi:RNA polymerase sigma-70 factor (ECF subfamily)
MSKNDHLEDSELVTKYLNGDTKVLSVLVKRYHKGFCSKAHWIVKDADLAKDIAQDCWTVIIDKLKTLEDVGSFKGWANRIVYRNSLDELRKIARNRMKLDEYSREKSNATEEDESDNDLKKKLLKSIKGLPERQQSVLKLFYIEEYSLKDIAVILNISTGTVKSRLFHAREKLKQLLKTRNYEK